METSWRIVRRAAAIEDLYDVWRYLAIHDDANADRWLDRIEDAIHRLCQYPYAGGTRDSLPGDIRVWPVQPWLILYRAIDDLQQVEILRVIDGRRDVARTLTG